MQIIQSINARLTAELVKVQLLGKGEKEAGHHCVMILTVTSRKGVNG